MQQLTFLVVEDHDFQRSMLVKMLTSLHVKAVHDAADGRAALLLLENLAAPVDVVVSDLDMPSMDGMEFIRHLGIRWPGTSLIIVSALERGLLSSVETMAIAYGVDFVGTIEKPVTPRKLEELIGADRRVVAAVSRRGTTRLSFTAEEIAEGIRKDEFEPYFQPKVDISSGHIVGAEGLARWQHPEHGLVAPSAFIEPLEASGKIDLLMRCMLRKSAATCGVLHRAGHQTTISVNVSLKSLHDVTLADQILEVVRMENIDPRQIVLEITESAATTDVAASLENLTRLRMKGFGLAIDDYGTGYSSLEQLTRIPFTELKIDQAFVTHASRRESAKVILASSLDMARKLGITAVAEGVETRENWDMLCELKCGVAQGYYIARPMPASVYFDWVADWPRMHGSR